VLSYIRFILSDNSVRKGWFVEKNVLSTRPHLREVVEMEFNVRAFSLVPLTKKEQEFFIRKRTDSKKAKTILKNLSSSTHELMSNPLMLSMYCSVFDPKTKLIDHYEMYGKFMVKKHELYVSEKLGQVHLPLRVVKQLLAGSLPFYNRLAIIEILGEFKLKIICDLAENACCKEIIQKVSSPMRQNKLLSFGVVVKVGEELKFTHRTFAEFFYVTLMTDVKNTPKHVRNALFAYGYEVGNNLAQLVSCVIEKDAGAVQFISPGWTRFVPEGRKLDTYVDRNGNLFKHIMSITGEYEENLAGKNKRLLFLLVPYHEHLFGH